MLEENSDNDKNINLSNYNGNNGNNGNSEFKVIKGNSPVGSAERPASLILDSAQHEHKASGIGLDLLANPQKKKIDNDNNYQKSPERIEKKPVPEKPVLFNTPVTTTNNNLYEKEALEESLVDQQDLYQSNLPKKTEVDKLSFVSTISSKKNSKRVHHFDLNHGSPTRPNLSPSPSPNRQINRGGHGFDNSSLNNSFTNIPGSFNKSSSEDIGDVNQSVELNIQKQRPIGLNPLNIQDDIRDQLDRASSCSTPVVPKRLTFEEIKKEKEELIYKFEKMRRLGMNIPKRFNMTSDLDEMKGEYERLKRDKEVENGIKFSRKVLMAITTGMEFLNNKFDPCDLKLDGWSESVHENIGEYDEVFEELNEKYRGTAKVSPEIKLLLMMGGSAFMFHLTNTMFKSALPGMGDIMKQNPDLMKQFASAALNTMNEQENPPGSIAGGGNNNFIPPNNPFENNQPVRQPMPPKREMRGPTGVDEILQEFQNEQGDNTSMTSSQFERKMMNHTSGGNNESQGGTGNRRQFSLNM